MSHISLKNNLNIAINKKRSIGSCNITLNNLYNFVKHNHFSFRIISKCIQRTTGEETLIAEHICLDLFPPFDHKTCLPINCRILAST